MLERIVCINNVGVIKNGVPNAVEPKRVSLIYADNARGKSTLSSLLLACSTADTKDITDRKTVGSSTEQKIILRFKNTNGSYNSEFDGKSWKGAKPNLHVFNQTFVEKNVFASTGVLPEQREGLLTLALGDAAVAERSKFEKQAALQKECAGKVTAAEAAVTGFRGNFSVDQFIALTPLENVDELLAQVDQKIAEARSFEQIAKRPEFKHVIAPVFNFDDISLVVRSSFESVVLEAEELVKAHFRRHNGASTERWALEGMKHNVDDDCPFCGQATNNLALVKAYQSYFDGAYSNHLAKVAGLRANLIAQLNEGQLASWTASPAFNEEIRGIWDANLGAFEFPPIDVSLALDLLKEIQLELLCIVDKKEQSPMTALESETFSDSLGKLSSLFSIASAYNVEITSLNIRIADYKASFSKIDEADLVLKRRHLVMKKTRHEAETQRLVGLIQAARLEYKAAEAAKDAARIQLDNLMHATLATFQQSINFWLVKFATPFLVDELAPTYKGGGLRSEYVLKVRGTRVNVGPGGVGELSFHAALSEGDKRTLAFAFFLAKLFADPEKAGATVVLDDVFTSLDKHRRHNTIEAVLKMVQDCAQVIALGHDAHFLRELKKRVDKKKLGPVIELALNRDLSDFSYLDNFDLDDYCSSEYYKHYILVERFVNAEAVGNLIEVAKSLRLLVEGHLHRCFPKKFKEGQTVGEMLALVKNASAPNPLSKLHSLHAELVNFNDFAAAFHHDTSGGYPRTEVNEAELLPFAKGALGFIQVRSFTEL